MADFSLTNDQFLNLIISMMSNFARAFEPILTHSMCMIFFIFIFRQLSWSLNNINFQIFRVLSFLTLHGGVEVFRWQRNVFSIISVFLFFLLFCVCVRVCMGGGYEMKILSGRVKDEKKPSFLFSFFWGRIFGFLPTHHAVLKGKAPSRNGRS